MKNIEKEFERSGYAKIPEKAQKPGSFLAGQKHPDINVGAEALKKEFRENSFGKASMLELLIDKLIVNLEKPENSEIINKALKEEDAVKNLADEIWEYTVKFGSGSEKIDIDNNAKDLINHFETSLLGFARRAKKKGLDSDYQEIISKEFNSLRDYFHLLKNSRDFERAEIGSKSGYLAGRIKKEDLSALKKNKAEYVERCKEILKAEEEKNIGK